MFLIRKVYPPHPVQCHPEILRLTRKLYTPIIGVERFRILGGGGGQGVEYWGGGGGGGGARGANSQQAHDVVTTSMRRNDVIST